MALTSDGEVSKMSLGLILIPGMTQPPQSVSFLYSDYWACNT